MIKYFCDFCKGETTKEECHIIDAEKTLCKNCYDHLKIQTWRLAEDPTVLEKQKKALNQACSDFKKEKENWEKAHATDFKLAQRYRNGMYTAFRMYNDIIYQLNNNYPVSIWRASPHFSQIDLNKIPSIENEAFQDVVKEVDKLFRNSYEENFYGIDYMDKSLKVFDTHFDSLPEESKLSQFLEHLKK